jgi:hypothetical protein
MRWDLLGPDDVTFVWKCHRCIHEYESVIVIDTYDMVLVFDRGK